MKLKFATFFLVTALVDNSLGARSVTTPPVNAYKYRYICHFCSNIKKYSYKACHLRRRYHSLRRDFSINAGVGRCYSTAGISAVMSGTNHNKKTTGESSSVNCLSPTFGSFANRLQRQLKEQQEQEGDLQRAKDTRHSTMLYAMTTIRKALQETCKIKLGERFGFELDVSDWEGWPRVELGLIDSLIPNRIELGLIVTSNDRNDLGVVQIAMKSGEVLDRLHFCNDQESHRLPLVLKRCVRDFLDSVSAYVLNPIRPEDAIETETKPLEVTDLDELSARLKDEDMFTPDEEYSPAQNIVDSE